MTETVIVGLDIAKQTFQVHGMTEDGEKSFSKKLARQDVQMFFRDLPSCLVAMEACGSAHHWARVVREAGHHPRLIPAQYVKPFVRRGKTDAADAEAICIAAGRKDINSVPVKTVQQQVVTCAIKTRSLFVRQRTKAVNALRGHLAEFGIVTKRGVENVRSIVSQGAEEAVAIPVSVCATLLVLCDEITMLSRRIVELDKTISDHAKHDDVAKRLTTIPGVGKMTAAAICAYVPDASAFKSSRHFAAWLGLTPRVHNSGASARSGGISKMGNPELRRLLVMGAISVVQQSKRDTWLSHLVVRRPFRVAAVALANKNARIVWALLTKGGEYKPRAGPRDKSLS